MAKKFPPLLYNPISMFGVLIALMALIAFIVLLLMEYLAEESSIYSGIIIFLLVPTFLVVGLVLIPFGIWRAKKKGKGYPVIDFPDGKVRNAFWVFSAGTLVLVIFSAFGSYQLYEYSESKAFCGLTCHTVMSPEFTVFEHGPHAATKCVSCHVGEGAGSYVQAKLSGVRQLWHAVLGDYQRPIPTPVHNMKAPEETCAHCHDFDYPMDARIKRFVHYYEEDEPIRHSYDLTFDMDGDGYSGKKGIHWHVQTPVYYLEDEEHPDKILAVKTVLAGKERLYLRGDNVPGSEAPWKTMSCLTCHNRPAHVFAHPNDLVDQALEQGQLDPAIEGIRWAAIDLLTEMADADRSEALKTLAEEELDLEWSDHLDDEGFRGIVKALYNANIFPEMKADWRTHRNYKGHFREVGCDRCHDGKHKTENGLAISNDCQTCHQFAKIQIGSDVYVEAGLEFMHPDGEEDWRDDSCTECHGD